MLCAPCFMNVGVLAPEWSPDIYVRTPLLTITEVFSSAVLAGGSILRQPPWPR